MDKFFKYITSSPIKRCGLIVLALGILYLIIFSTHRNFSFNRVFEFERIEYYPICFIPLGLIMISGFFDFIFQWIKTGKAEIPKIKFTKKLIVIILSIVFFPIVFLMLGGITYDYFKQKRDNEYYKNLCKIEDCSAYAASEPVGIDSESMESGYILSGESLNNGSKESPTLLIEPLSIQKPNEPTPVVSSDQHTEIKLSYTPDENILFELEKANDMPPPRQKLTPENISSGDAAKDRAMSIILGDKSVSKKEIIMSDNDAKALLSEDVDYPH